MRDHAIHFAGHTCTADVCAHDDVQARPAEAVEDVRHANRRSLTRHDKGGPYFHAWGKAVVAAAALGRGSYECAKKRHLWITSCRFSVCLLTLRGLADATGVGSEPPDGVASKGLWPEGE